MNVGISSALDYSFGIKSNDSYFFHSLNIGPRILIDNVLMLGVDYNYFLNKPKFFDWGKYPHWFGITLGYNFSK